MKKVAMQSFLKGLFLNASLKLFNISLKLPPIALNVNGEKLTSFFVDLLLIKIAGIIAKKFTDINGNIIFGRYIPKQNADVCCLVSTGKEESDIMTIRNADKLSLQEISKKVEEKKRNIENKTDADYNRRLFIAQFIPTL